MNPVDLIIKKRDSGEFSTEELRFFIAGVCDDRWPDYQISAMLMAMFIRGLSARETADLTLAMAESGDQFNLDAIPGIKVDKHSTGGVADTTTLIVAPLVASCGVSVVKMSGRGLGFTGGTIDKLESIPGFQVDLSEAEALALIRQNQVVIMSQTGNLTPADKKLYALRDVTGTVESLPLIAASIMSKKIAAGADAIILDVKCGSGAFMRDLPQARALAELMVSIGRQVGRQVTAVISSMNQPLGQNIGNALEVIEAIDVLKGRVSGDLLEVSLAIGSQMLVSAGAAAHEAAARIMLLKQIQNGAALERLRRMIAGQKGNPAVIDDYQLLPQSAYQVVWPAPCSGYLTAMDTAAIGRIFVDLGGGRKKKNDTIDYAAGLIFYHRIGDYIIAGQPLAEIHAQDPGKIERAKEQLGKALSFGHEPAASSPVILDLIH
ncbi:MAG: thymidine phosphorylase [Clostridiaceae bacterium]|nr:thymidine phosphorylase [Clostridiaceae bacterium]